MAPEAPWGAQTWPPPLMVVLFTNKQEGAYCIPGERSGKKLMNRSSGAKKLASETIDRKGRGVGRQI